MKRTLASTWVLACCASLLFAARSPARDLAPGHVRIRASIAPGRVLVGQRAELRVDVLTRTWFLGAPAYPDTLDVPKAVVLRPDTFGVNFSERIGGVGYAGQSRTYAVFPVAPGRLTIPPVSVTLVVARDDASRSDPVTLTTEPLQLVAEVPASARGLGLVPATPKLTVTQEWTRTEGAWEVGEAVTRTVSQTIEGSVAMVLPAVASTAPEGVAAYPDRPVMETKSDRGAMNGRRTDAVTYVFEREGRYRLPEVVIRWWDLGAGRLRTESLPGLSVEVAANPGLAAENLRAAEDEVAGEPAGRPPLPRPRWRAALVVVAVLAGLWAVRRRLAAAVRRILRLLFSPPPAERRAWRRLRRSIAGEDAPAVLSALYRWLDEACREAGGPWRDAVGRAGGDAVKGLEALERAAVRGDRTWSRAATRRAVEEVRRHLAGARRRPEGRLVSLNPSGPEPLRTEARP